MLGSSSPRGRAAVPGTEKVSNFSPSEGIASLNAVLKNLDGQQVVIQVREPERRGWFRKKKKSDG